MNPALSAFIQELTVVKVAELIEQPGVLPEAPPAPVMRSPYQALVRSALVGGLGYGLGAGAASLGGMAMRPVLGGLSPRALSALRHALGAAVSGASMAFLSSADQHQRALTGPPPDEQRRGA